MPPLDYDPRIRPLVEAAQIVGAADDGADGDDGQIVRRSFAVTVRAVDKQARSVEVTVSTDTLDAYGDVVDQDWDLSRFSKNPVVLWNHNRSGLFAGPEADLPIGHADAAVKNGQLEAKLTFVDERANPMAEKVFQGFLQGSIRAVSAGFRPHTVSREMKDDLEFYRLSDNELYEISVCPIPVNPDAVAKGKAKAFAQLKALASRSSKSTSPQPIAPAEGAQKETAMDPKELEAKIKSLETQLATQTDALSTSNKALEAANALVTDLTGKLAVAEKALADTKTTLAETSTKLAAETERATKAEHEVIKSGVAALVGKKITPAELEDFQALAIENPARYKSMIEKRADLPTAVGTVVVPPDKSSTAERSVSDSSEGFETMVPEVPGAGGFEDLEAASE